MSQAASSMLRKLAGETRKARPDVVDVLSEHHARIRAVSAAAISLGEASDLRAVDIVDGCAVVERYFADALHLHMRDEQESVVPRLRGRSAAIDAALGRLLDQHALHAKVAREMCAAARDLRFDPRSARARSKLLAVARPVELLLDAHLRREEETMFSAIRELVPLEEQEAIWRELRARRVVDPVD